MNKLAAVLALGFAGAGGAWGQAGEFWFNFGESIMANNGIGTELPFGTPNDIKLGNSYRFSFRFDWNQREHFGHEFGLAFNHSFFDLSPSACAVQGFENSNGTTSCSAPMHMWQGGYNFLYYPLTTSSSRIRPFVTAGVGFNDFVYPGGAINEGSSDKFGFNGGVGVKFHIHGMFAGRIDVREYTMPKPSFGLLQTSGWLLQTEASAGVGIGF